MKIAFHYITAFTIMVLFLSGCYDVRLLKTEPLVAPLNKQKISPSNQRKFSYAGPYYAEKALHDSFFANGISNVKEYEKLEDDRTTILVYTFEEPTQYFWFPWVLVSVATLNIVPINERHSYRVEVNIIDPKKEFDKQIKVIHAGYVTSTWYWLYWLPSSNMEASIDSVKYEGFRRIFDHIIAEELENP
jgi:hypothetical protein